MELLYNKKFMSALAYVVAVVFVILFPEFEGRELEIAAGVTVVFASILAYLMRGTPQE